MQQTFLIIHILGAIATLGLILGAGFDIAKNASTRLASFAKWIAYASLFELATGSAVTLASPKNPGHITDFCAKIGLYLLVIIAAETLLAWQIHKTKMKFPRMAVLRPMTLGTIIAAITLSIIA